MSDLIGDFKLDFNWDVKRQINSINVWFKMIWQGIDEFDKANKHFRHELFATKGSCIVNECNTISSVTISGSGSGSKNLDGIFICHKHKMQFGKCLFELFNEKKFGISSQQRVEDCISQFCRSDATLAKITPNYYIGSNEYFCNCMAYLQCELQAIEDLSKRYNFDKNGDSHGSYNSNLDSILTLGDQSLVVDFLFLSYTFIREIMKLLIILHSCFNWRDICSFYPLFEQALGTRMCSQLFAIKINPKTKKPENINNGNININTSWTIVESPAAMFYNYIVVNFDENTSVQHLALILKHKILLQQSLHLILIFNDLLSELVCKGTIRKENTFEDYIKLNSKNDDSNNENKLEMDDEDDDETDDEDEENENKEQLMLALDSEKNSNSKSNSRRLTPDKYASMIIQKLHEMTENIKTKQALESIQVADGRFSSALGTGLKNHHESQNDVEDENISKVLCQS